VKIVGEAPGTKLGGILNVQFNTIPVHGMPKDIPNLLTIDVSSLNIGDSIHVHEIDFGKVEPMLPAERVLVTVIQPRALVAEATAGEGAEVAEGEEGEAAEATEETAAEES
jgi:large subunit ribosomal protein L25